ncbi:MAG: 1-acyl-sn-glycerol-3-phosphate acyltransferase [Deltaproteobacteria bacterium]|nr:1-acyl-sn-glycerol-3-phosphate acyltransferase [Deltaproteobacteria bacterium]
MIFVDVARGLVFALYTGVCSVLALFGLLLGPRALAAVARVWGRGALAIAGVRLVVEGLDAVDGSRAHLLMSTHTSHFDTPALYAALPFPVRFVAKKELTYLPIFGWVLALGVAIVIDRKDRAQAIRSIERAKRTVAGGWSVLVFPEGTRTPEGTIGPFKKGPFHLAVGARVPILPIAVLGTGAVLPVGGWRIRPGRVVVRVGPAIQPPAQGIAEDAQRAQLAAEVEAAFRALVPAPVPLDRLDGDA